ncbi:hypothetical protein PAXINDRAFT_63986 [Paxillus involutus ATCC 200175]|nr:hypothetical protein PAXINDRAFT_63986 [Paxillus involutus ATCC 200175]
MPGLNLNTASILVVEHRTPESFLSVAYPTLLHHERSSNIVLAPALKQVSAEAALTGCQFVTHPEVSLDLSPSDGPNESLWLTLWSTSPGNTCDLEMVLACHRAGQNDLPVFLWSPQSRLLLSPQWLNSRVSPLAERLVSCVPPTRIFSVFGATPLVKAFCKSWTTLTGFQIEPEPFYSSCFTYCTKETITDSPDDHLSVRHCTRRAMSSDIEDVARLCKEFADDSIYFPLTIERARVEADELISKGQVWLYEVSGAVAAICAVTRTSLNVSAITKVYTCPNWRRRGFAEHLVRYVTRKLFECGKGSVVLYVGHENSARRVYHRVGFVGLLDQEKPEGVEDALELGFIGTDRGHW